MDKWLPPTITSGAGFLEKGIDYLYNEHNKADEKQWWYEQQKYLEEHNSPAYQAMKLRQAGLNPYSEVQPVSLGNVNSSLPNSPLAHIDQSALSQSLMVSSVIDKNNADAHKSNVESGLIEEKVKTESEWRSNIIQQTLNLQQAYTLGLITEEERNLQLEELKKAYENGYNGYLIEKDLAESTLKLNDSLILLNEAKQGREYQETLNLVVEHAAMTLELELDRFFEPLMRQAELDGVNLNLKFSQEEFKEWLDTQDVRIALFNVQKAFAKLAVDDATRQDLLNRIINESDRILAEQILDAVKNGDGLDYTILSIMKDNPSAFLTSLSNIVGSFAPSFNINRNSTTIRKVVK